MAWGHLLGLFWEHVSPCPDTGCWLWTEDAGVNGYGRVWMLGKQMYAHRLSYLMHVGDLEAGDLVAHKCDVPLCVNPLHLFKTDDAGNSADKVAKGRQARGEAFPQARLTSDAVREIRTAYGRGGVSQAEIAARFSVSGAHVSDIVNRRRWRHIA